MKKNTMMRVASALLVAVLLTTCAISGTFAKYVTSAEANDSARVAAFGVEVTGTATTFAESYNETGSVTVNSTEKVVAPGTDGALADFTITGSPEVAVTVTYTADLELAGWVVDGVVYCPIVFNVAGTEYTIGASETLDAFEARVEAAIVAVKTSYAVGETIDSTLAVSWSWEFSTSAANDIKDTKLGDAAAAGSASTIDLDVTCTVTQID